MKILAKIIKPALLIILISISIQSYSKPRQTKNSPVITELKSIIKNDNFFSQDLQKALTAMPKKSYWHNKKPEDLVGFFNSWLNYDPLPTKEFKYVSTFADLAYTKKGRIFSRQPVFLSWLVDFFDARGKYMDSPESAKYMQQWMQYEGKKMQQYIVPKGGYKTFNAYITRNVKPGARPIAKPNNKCVIVSANDGYLQLLLPVLKNTSKLKAKGDIYNIRQIFNDNPLAKKFIGGPAFISNLHFKDYHHFGAPLGGKILQAQEFAGLYEDNDSPTMYQDTYKHRRGVYIIKNSKVGLVGMVPIGFWMVSSINMTAHKNQIVKKGQKLGYFAYGGSAILLFFEPNKIKLTKKLYRKKLTTIEYGQEFATVNNCKN